MECHECSNHDNERLGCTMGLNLLVPLLAGLKNQFSMYQISDVQVRERSLSLERGD